MAYNGLFMPYKCPIIYRSQKHGVKRETKEFKLLVYLERNAKFESQTAKTVYRMLQQMFQKGNGHSYI